MMGQTRDEWIVTGAIGLAFVLVCVGAAWTTGNWEPLPLALGIVAGSLSFTCFLGWLMS